MIMLPKLPQILPFLAKSTYLHIMVELLITYGLKKIKSLGQKLCPWNTF